MQASVLFIIMMLALLSIGSLQDPDAALDQAHGDGIAHAETLRQLGVVDLHDDGLLIQHDLVLDLFPAGDALSYDLP